MAGALLAVVLRRPDLVVLFSPLALGVAIDWRAPVSRALGVRTIAVEVTRQGDGVEVRHHLSGAPVGACIAIRGGADAQSATRLLSASQHAVTERTTAATWGPHRVSPTSALAVTGWAGWSAVAQVPPSTLTVLPRRDPPRLALLPHPVGVGPGPHPGLRNGSGTDFAGLIPLADGEPARRVNWPATLRTGNVVVHQTHQDTTGAYLIVLEAGADQQRHDEVVHTIAGTCTRLIREGAYVAMTVHGCGDLAPVRLGAGPRHLTRLETSLAHATPRPADPAGDHQHRRVHRLPLPVGTVALTFTPMRDPAFIRMLGRLHASRLRVTVIDTWSPTAVPLDELEHRVRHLELESRGIPVTAWDSPSPTINTALRRLRGRAA